MPEGLEVPGRGSMSQRDGFALAAGLGKRGAKIGPTEIDA